MITFNLWPKNALGFSRFQSTNLPCNTNMYRFQSNGDWLWFPWRHLSSWFINKERENFAANRCLNLKKLKCFSVFTFLLVEKKSQQSNLEVIPVLTVYLCNHLHWSDDEECHEKPFPAYFVESQHSAETNHHFSDDAHI